MAATGEGRRHICLVRVERVDQGQALYRLDGRARKDRALDIAGGEHHAAIGIDDDRRAAVARFDDIAARDLGENRVFHGDLRYPPAASLPPFGADAGSCQKRWREVRPVPFRFATWVGYDMDGRTDIGWNTSVRYRLAEKAERLAAYAADLASAAPDISARLARAVNGAER